MTEDTTLTRTTLYCNLRASYGYLLAVTCFKDNQSGEYYLTQNEFDRIVQYVDSDGESGIHYMVTVPQSPFEEEEIVPTLRGKRVHVVSQSCFDRWDRLCNIARAATLNMSDCLDDEEDECCEAPLNTKGIIN